MKPLRGRMDEDGRIFDQKTGDYTYRIEKDGEVRDLKSGDRVGHIEKDGRFWNSKENKYTLKIESDGRIWDIKKGCYYRDPNMIEKPMIEGYKPPSDEAFSPLPVELFLPFLVFFVFIILLASLYEVGLSKIESLTNRIYPAYETRAEKSTKIEAEKKRIYASLNKWIDEWLRKNQSRWKKYDFYSSCSFEHLDRVNGDIWVIADIPFHDENIHTESYIACVEKRQFILHGSDNGRSWEIKWQAPPLRNYVWPIRLYRIQVIDKQRVCVAAVAADNPAGYSMLYTINGGESWQIDKKWDPRKVERLRL